MHVAPKMAHRFGVFYKFGREINKKKIRNGKHQNTPNSASRGCTVVDLSVLRWVIRMSHISTLDLEAHPDEHHSALLTMKFCRSHP